MSSPELIVSALGVAGGLVTLVRETATRRNARAAKAAEIKTADNAARVEVKAAEIADRAAFMSELWERIEKLETKQERCEQEGDALRAKLATAEIERERGRQATEKLEDEVFKLRGQHRAAERRAQALHEEMDGLREKKLR